jgi:deoxyribonuclease (pyrimidine dimer)
MTRINLVKPIDLADQHLLAEYRELPRVFTYVKKYGIPNDIPDKFKFGKGFLKFFTNKLNFLIQRYNQIVIELEKRGYSIQYKELKPYCYGLAKRKEQIEYTPSKEEIELSLERINEKLNMKPNFYSYYGEKYYE